MKNGLQNVSGRLTTCLPDEAMPGILMCSLSAGLFFALVTRIYAARLEARPK
jgi:hypothetical protein